MRALIQRVKESSVSVGGTTHSRIGQGLLILLGVARTDTADDARYLAGRCANLRVFEDQEGKMNLSVIDVGGKALVVSQFTLYADTRRGNRPGFSDAAPPESAEGLYDEYVRQLRVALGDANVETGVFRAMMDVSLINDGPVTIMIESKHDDR
jgi:D-tyrosyl-tRNA(Tyr) deacylase